MGQLAVDRDEPVWFALAATSITCFVVGMALLGVSWLSGYFYVASLVFGAPLLLRMDYGKMAVPRAIVVYLLFLFAFAVVWMVHLLTGHEDLGAFDYGSRPWFGVVNGFFFLALFRFDRHALFSFIGFIAACHAAIAIAVALGQGVDFLALELTGERSHGATNPIPFSNMLLASAGLAAIVFASRMRGREAVVDIGIIVVVLLVGTLAVLLTGTRGTLLAVPLLALLLIIGYRSRFSRRTILSTIIAFVFASILAVMAVFALWPDEFMQAVARSGSDMMRLRLLSLSWPIIGDAPLFGHGLNSVPQVFADLGLVRSETSRLFGYNHMHNQYLDMLVKTGIVGTVLFFGPIAVSIVAAARLVAVPGERVFALAILWVAGAYCVFGLTTSFFGHANTTLQLGVYLGMLIWLLPPPRQGAGAAADALP